MKLKWLWPAVGALALMGLIYVVAGSTIDHALDRSERELENFQNEGVSSNQRLASYRDSWEMFQDKPVWGWGIGSFIHIHPIYAGPEFYPEGAEYPIAYEFTHSDYLQCLVEFGWAGCLLFFGPFILLVVGLWRLKPWASRFGRWPLYASIGVAVTACFDMTLTAPAIAMGVLLCAAASVAYAGRGRLV